MYGVNYDLSPVVWRLLMIPDFLEDHIKHQRSLVLPLAFNNSAVILSIPGAL
jgi:hypothetical protein